ncbi:hypothetical protein [Bartonella sp. AR 15-3]|uniref:hypothetical protein n=1 Tax=Bartonella sp. AR 15-3 TaxID=545617 RepID=UPI00099B1D2F|nr:hypothetical protein BAR153v2_005140 [Bartonella sp. AR 15-3]
MAPYFDPVLKSIVSFNKKFAEDYAPETILNDILNGDKILWIIVDAHENFMAHVTTELQKLITGTLRAVIVTLSGRGGKHLSQVIPQIEAYYKEKGAKELLIIGRRGWKKSLQSHGYVVNLLEYRKQL